MKESDWECAKRSQEVITRYNKYQQKQAGRLPRADSTQHALRIYNHLEYILSDAPLILRVGR